ncbi:hypothetical protein [Chryseobacterium sp. NFX27]|uniref:hypothetical protein n=1 Tax=Chryseobacterium sp. NFX27 TaxID=2819618 RepID=UPI003CE9B3E3
MHIQLRAHLTVIVTETLHRAVLIHHPVRIIEALHRVEPLQIRVAFSQAPGAVLQVIKVLPAALLPAALLSEAVLRASGVAALPDLLAASEVHLQVEDVNLKYMDANNKVIITKRIVFLHSSIDDLIYKIRHDIYRLAGTNIQRERIRISIPEFYQEILENRIRNDYKFFHFTTNLRTYFGCEVVSGYNNQICVFDKFARPGDMFLDPIEIKSNDK